MRILLGAALLLCQTLPGSDWRQFRGPNGSGVSDAINLPVEFGPDKNVIWRTAVPPGHSSPVIAGERIFLTAADGEKLLTLALDRKTGRILWRREIPRPRVQELHKSNHPASPSAVTDGENVYAFFTDFGLIAHGPDGNELWRHPLGPFNNPFGMGASPVLANGKVLMICDAESGSFFIAVDQKTGRQVWRVERPEVTRGFSTPVLYRPKEGPLQAIVAGSYQLTSYNVDTGQPVWWTSGLTWQLKPTPVLDEAKGIIYVLGWAGGSDTGQQETIEPFEQALARWDANNDGKLAKEEISDAKVTKDWRAVDLDTDGALGARDWRFYRSRRAAQNGLTAFRVGGKGDVSATAMLWRYTKSLPNVPSPLLHDGVVYLAKESGIFTALDAATGDVLKQGRLSNAPGFYYSSPVAADGKIFTTSESGVVTVIKPGANWEVLASNDFGEPSHSTPAFAHNRVYVRTHQALYCLGKQD
jgi:outer membrane protein assembly factor BamB